MEHTSDTTGGATNTSNHSTDGSSSHAPGWRMILDMLMAHQKMTPVAHRKMSRQVRYITDGNIDVSYINVIPE